MKKSQNKPGKKCQFCIHSMRDCRLMVVFKTAEINSCPDFRGMTESELRNLKSQDT